MNWQYIDNYCQKHGYNSQDFVEEGTENVITMVWVDEENVIMFSPDYNPTAENQDQSEDWSLNIFFQKEGSLKFDITLRNPTYRDFARVLDLIVSMSTKQKTVNQQ